MLYRLTLAKALEKICLILVKNLFNMNKCYKICCSLFVDALTNVYALNNVNKFVSVKCYREDT